jgi:type IV pilus assembly protein PilY1
LADNAFNYWYQDLRPDLTNNVSTYLEVGTAEPVTPPAIPNPFYPASLPWDSRNDPASWQHMQTFTIGMGVTGTLNPANYFDTTLPNSAGDWDELKAGTTAWPLPCDGCATDINNIDDLWHAAVNSRGSYHSARDPDALLAAFNKIISKINRDSGSAAGLGASGSSTSGGGTSIFQSVYDTKWVGRLLSRTVDANGIPQSLAWEAGTGLAGGSGAPGLNSLNYDARKIITYNPLKAVGTRGIPFRWDTSNLSAAQQTALRTNAKNTLDPVSTGQARLEYLRGASANEGSSLNFRVRGCYDRATVESQYPTVIACPADVGKLGDIINSSPVYVGKPDFTYPDSLESVPYSTFVKDPLNTGSSSTRLPMVYVGANDGMLHGFQASDGAEQIAYVPNLVYSNISTNNLSLLSDEFYSHRYYVDGTPTVGDVFIGGAWRTMLVGGLRKGGKGYYALDITDPSSYSEANAAQIAKWEFTDPDMGFSYSQATITKIADSTGTGTPQSRWVAIFGNGYNNTGTGRAMIFVVDIATGALIQKIDTGVSGGGGSVATPNGMATPAVVDMNDDYVADYIYAGDLLGNMWRIDIRSNTPANWNTAANVTLLFTAKDNAVPPVRQPITTKPATGFHPAGFGGLMVYFGTGKYLEGGDNAATGTPQRQSFYAIYDRGVTGRRTEPSRKEATAIARADLLAQTITLGAPVVNTFTSPPTTFNTRNISDLPINWRLDRTSTTTHLGWFVDLPDFGEKQVTSPLLREGRIIFTTLSPPTDVCTQGNGTGWLMELNATNGGRLGETLDLNGDTLFSSLDGGGANYGAAGAQVVGGGSLSSPVVLTNPDGPPPPASGARYSETKLTVSSTGAIVSIKESGTPNAPEAWRQLR